MQKNNNNNNNNNINIMSEYKFCEIIERGTFSKILKGMHKESKRIVAIKEILVEQKIEDNGEIIDKFNQTLKKT